MKDAIAVSFYVCDLEEHKQERINDPCGKWLWEWIGIEPEIPDQWLIDNSSTYTELQLNYIYVANQDLLAGAEEDVIQCEADRLVVTPTVEPGWTLRVTTDLNNITTSSDYQITDNRKSTQLTVNFGNGTGDNAGCSPLPLELFSVVTDTYFTVFNEISGEWTLDHVIISQTIPPDFGTYLKTVGFSNNYKLKYEFNLNMPKMGIFGPVFTTTVPESVINRVDVDQVLNYTFRATNSLIPYTYLALGIEILHVESGQSVAFSAFDKSAIPQEPPSKVYSMSISYIGDDLITLNKDSIEIGKIIDNPSYEYGDRTFSVVEAANHGLPENGTYEISYFLLAAGFSSELYDVISQAANPNYIPKDMAFNPIFLNNIPTIVGYTPGDYGLLKSTVTQHIPIDLTTALQFTLTHTQQKCWVYYQIDVTNTTNVDLTLAFYADEYYPLNWWMSLNAGETRSIYLSKPYSGNDEYNDVLVYLTETDGTKSEPPNMPEMTIDGTYLLKRFAYDGTFNATGNNIDSWLMGLASITIEPDQIEGFFGVSLTPDSMVYGNLWFAAEVWDETAQDWYYDPEIEDTQYWVTLSDYLPIIESFGLDPFNFKIHPGVNGTYTFNQYAASYCCLGVYTLSEVYVSESQVFTELASLIESRAIDQNTGLPRFRNVDLTPHNHFGYDLSQIYHDQRVTLSATGFATYLTINL